MTDFFFVQKWRFFFKHLPILRKTIFSQSRTCFSSYTYADEEKKLFLFQLQISGSSSACRKKTRCWRMAPVPPFWDICQWQNFPGNLKTWPNTSSKRFFLLPFLQPKKNVQKSMLLHWCCPLTFSLMKRLTLNMNFLWQQCTFQIRKYQLTRNWPYINSLWNNYRSDWPLKATQIQSKWKLKLEYLIIRTVKPGWNSIN